MHRLWRFSIGRLKLDLLDLSFNFSIFSYSCGYRKAFEEYQKILSEKYPELQVNGANYDPPGMNLYLQRLILVAKFVLIGLVLSSYDVFAFLGMAQPVFWTWAVENKLFAVMMTFFFGNMLEAQLMSTGAFEIILNDIPVWSKIATGRIPSPSELFAIIESHLQFTDNFFEKNPDFVK